MAMRELAEQVPRKNGRKCSRRRNGADEIFMSLDIFIEKQSFSAAC
jgi:hypothetical protein